MKKYAYFFGSKLNNWFSLSEETRNELIEQGIKKGFLINVPKLHQWNLLDTDVWENILPTGVSFKNFECIFVA